MFWVTQGVTAMQRAWAHHTLQNSRGDYYVSISGMYTKIGRLKSPFIAAHRKEAVQSRRATLSMMGTDYSG